VNINDFRLADPRPDKGVAFIRIAFTASTFSSVPEEELAKNADQKSAKGAPRKK